MKYNIENVQLAVIFIDFISFNSKDVWNSVSKNIEVFKETEPFIIPNDKNNPLPLEIPKLTFNNGTSQLIISNLRIDFTFKASSNDLEIIKSNLYELNNMIKELNINNKFRLGIVLSCSISHKDMLEEIKGLVNIENIKDSKEIQFSYFNDSSKNDFEINKWLRYFYTPTLENSTLLIDINNSINTLITPMENDKIDEILNRIEEVFNDSEHR